MIISGTCQTGSWKEIFPTPNRVRDISRANIKTLAMFWCERFLEDKRRCSKMASRATWSEILINGADSNLWERILPHRKGAISWIVSTIIVCNSRAQQQAKKLWWRLAFSERVSAGWSLSPGATARLGSVSVLADNHGFPQPAKRSQIEKRSKSQLIIAKPLSVFTMGDRQKHCWCRFVGDQLWLTQVQRCRTPNFGICKLFVMNGF